MRQGKKKRFAYDEEAILHRHKPRDGSKPHLAQEIDDPFAAHEHIVRLTPFARRCLGYPMHLGPVHVPTPRRAA